MSLSDSGFEWWRGAVIYQIYPRSFQDTKGTGMGDLKGITERLYHVASLGVDAIWVSPFFKSPMIDFGYDVEDYRSVDPMFGTLDDADEMIQMAHRLGLRVIVDMALSHTSERHPWFLESRRSQSTKKADWYVWADAKPDGSPPNNWLSMFGGVAWNWEPRRRQYYLHNFFANQPDLNLRNPDVQDALLAECQFWLDRGVDGFRLDACNYLFCDAELRDNPARPVDAPNTEGVKPDNPYNRQLHIHDKSQPETIGFLKRLRTLTDHYRDIFILGEIADDNSIDRIAEYAGPEGPIHSCYSFALLSDKLDLHVLKNYVEAFSDEQHQGWPAWAFSNHDVMRAITRWGGRQASPGFAKALLVLLLSLRGTVFIYQGEELGLHEVDVSLERIKDPFGLAFYPDFKGRDGCRTPMPWGDVDPRAEFSTVEPWLPIPNDHIINCVAAQNADAESVLNFLRGFQKWRVKEKVMLQGRINFFGVSDESLAFTRTYDDEQLAIAVNLSEKEVSIEPPHGRLQNLDRLGLSGRFEDGEIILPPNGCLIARVLEMPGSQAAQ